MLYENAHRYIELHFFHQPTEQMHAYDLRSQRHAAPGIHSDSQEFSPLALASCQWKCLLDSFLEILEIRAESSVWSRGELISSSHDYSGSRCRCKHEVRTAENALEGKPSGSPRTLYSIYSHLPWFELRCNVFFGFATGFREICRVTNLQPSSSRDLKRLWQSSGKSTKSLQHITCERFRAGCDG